MSDPRTLARLAEFQVAFSRVLRTPLDRSSRTLCAQLAQYDDAACAAVLPSQSLDAPERLAIYNRQYWFRLFGVMQQEYPLTARLVGMWRFNELAERFLLESPPRDQDLARVGDDFDAFVQRDVPGYGLDLGSAAPRIPSDALLQAARIDAGFRIAWRAPIEPSFRPTSSDVQRVAQGRLLASQAFVLVEERWPLMKLRNQSVHLDGEKPIPLPVAHPEGTRYFSISRVERIQHVKPLAPLQASLMQLLRSRPLRDALAQLEAQCTPEQSDLLRRNAQRWLAESIRLGYWIGVELSRPAG